ncbi:MAG: dephospho-CoA kinase [Burkholderiales bacterium]|jgi:dephospho-CoA kinase|nr:dephospho-CoA kinase [Burkholderiales bacterium]
MINHIRGYNYKVGLTGLIGSGKSIAAEYFAKLGVNIIDTDVISHKITSPGGVAIPHIVDTFGKGYISANGALNRPLMRELIFKNALEKHKLESILHPLIFDMVRAEVGKSGSLYTVIVVPLLFQAPRYHKYMDRSIFVDCNQSTIIDRVMKRSGWSMDTVILALDNQMPRIQQLALADDVLDNNKTPETLGLQVKILHEKYKNLAIT